MGESEVADDYGARHVTLRAALTGMVLGGALALCNIYTGLKVGWGINVSITAALLGYAFHAPLSRAFGRRPFGIFENNLNLTAASAAAAMSSAGLVSAMPALTMLTGQTLSFGWLTVWIGSISFLGVAVGATLRRQLIEVEKLPFPFGVATAETLREIYARGSEATARVRALIAGGLFASALKVTEELAKLPKVGLPGKITASGALAQKGLVTYSLKNLGFAIEPSLLMVGLGSLIGLRGCLSILLGVIISWGGIAPKLLEFGWAQPGKPNDVWFPPLVTWLLWPGVGLMVTSSLTSFAFSSGAIVRSLRRKTADTTVTAAGVDPTTPGYEVGRRPLLIASLLCLLLCVVVELYLFHIAPFAAVIGVLLTFLLAIVAGRVAGETGLTPVGPMGKVSQLALGVLAPGDPTANLMGANVTGGAASHCADILSDLKTGQLIGAFPRPQAIVQVLGVIAGSLAGSALYLALIPDPKTMLITAEWPAPAVVQWKAVAELFQKGFSTMPQGALVAFVIGAASGVVLALVEKLAPAKVRPFLPSPAALGLAFVIPAHNSVMIVIGGLIAALLTKRFPGWSSRFVVVIASGVIAGESLTGVVFALKRIFGH